MVFLKESVYDELVDWRREAKEEVKNLLFCPNCFQLVELKLREHKYFHNFYACTVCGETIFKRVTITSPLTSRGYSKERYGNK